ncbi:hypothetical protein SAMN05216275_14179 [Streptosporangium canum]|uniref:Uncharacterized protein n=1 Tax=Streptosporangium canum TaxID=324952 RepID=A0A1I4DJ02_9ACTN|nr:hypothetical protein [Streptosporangium canum]SFK92869.1 hypothetical protein SAMN05216275_14179 [Streptosporangium canum]
MSRPEDQRPDIDEATRLVEESQRRAAAEQARAREAAGRSLSIARLLRRLREENGFGRLMDEAFGGGRG